MKLRLEVIILLVLFLGLGAFAAYTAEQSGQQTLNTRATSFSSADNGVLALYRWLERMYTGRVDRLAYRPFILSEGDGLLFVLGPGERYEPSHVETVTNWVQNGGVLVIADNRPTPRSAVAPLLAVFDLELNRSTCISSATAIHPALGSPALENFSLETCVAIASTAPQSVLAPLAIAEGQPIVAGQRFGNGYVIVVASLYPFTNTGIREPTSAAFLLNLLHWLPANKRIVFDEFHHGFVPNADLRSLLLNHSLGWAVLYSVTVVGLYLLASSRRFGRPLPLRSEVARRSSTEYIDSMATMFRKTRQVAYAAEHYRYMLRRRLGQPYGIAQTLDDDAFVTQLATIRPIDQQKLRRIFAELRRPDLSEAELLWLVAESDQIVC
ncbi:DUF4350 domain-containing protein [Chloroflexus sp. Y-396-1]|uniref:DUF4350 domain-containing protein n=1 Tax=Chloroflexus sp. Y-396-1 TaxID=867845 RepID=UPI00048FDAF0|nr:DUF4350 domain-containing protein [Chloroflexus sp. Y-396-1]